MTQNLNLKLRLVIGVDLYDLEKRVNKFTKDYEYYFVELFPLMYMGAVWYDPKSDKRLKKRKKKGTSKSR